MNICHIIVALNVGGAERMLQRLVLAHGQMHGAAHTVVSLSTMGVIGAELAAAGVVVVSLGIKSPLDVPGGLVRLYRLLRQLNPDIVQTWMYHADLLGGLVARLAGVKAVIWGVRTTEIVRDGSGSAKYLRRVCAWVSSWLPYRIVCAAQASRRNHVAMGYAAERMAVVSNGFDVINRKPLSAAEVVSFRQAQGIGTEDRLVGFVGRFNAAKDVPNFVAAAQRVSQQWGDVRFMMVGTGMTWANAALVAVIQQHGLADRFVLLGERQDVAQCLGSLDVFCLSSRTEGFPNVVGEAMAVGVPCVVTDVGDAALIVGDTGVVVPKQDAAALAMGLGQLLKLNPSDRAQLGLRARQRIEAEFTMERAVEKFEEIYQQSTQSGTGR